METESFSPPFYILTTTESCWKCSAPNTVVALGGDGGGYFLTGITEMPEEFLNALRAVNPNYKMTASITAGGSYYANNCEKCGSLFGEHFLYSILGGAFWPETKQACQQIRVKKLRFDRSFEFSCCESTGLLQWILKVNEAQDITCLLKQRN